MIMFENCSSIQMQFSKQSNSFMNSFTSSNKMNNVISNVRYIWQTLIHILVKDVLWSYDVLEVNPSINDHMTDIHCTKVNYPICFQHENSDYNCRCKKTQKVYQKLFSCFVIGFQTKNGSVDAAKKKWLRQHVETLVADKLTWCIFKW